MEIVLIVFETSWRSVDKTIYSELKPKLNKTVITPNIPPLSILQGIANAYSIEISHYGLRFIRSVLRVAINILVQCRCTNISESHTKQDLPFTSTLGRFTYKSPQMVSSSTRPIYFTIPIRKPTPQTCKQ